MKEYQIAFVGNPNVGKSAWINALSDAHFKVGNWPGVTVEKKEATVIWEGKKLHLIDLPGTYALLDQANEETITTHYLMHEQVDLIVNIVDGTNLLRNLYLTMKLRQLQIPMIILCNFMDEVKRYHMKIDIPKLQERLQVSIYPYSAFDQNGKRAVMKGILEHLDQSVWYSPLLSQKDEATYSSVLNTIKKRIPVYANMQEKAMAWFVYDLMFHKRDAMRQLSAWDMEGCVDIPYREEEEDVHIFQCIQEMMDFVEDSELRFQLTRKLDRILLHPIWGSIGMFVILSLFMLIVFQGSAPFNDFIDFLINDMVMKYANALLFFLPEAAKDLILNGILAGVGGVLVFIPLMAFLHFALSFLEESGYMARIAYLLDHAMQQFHLNGKGFVSLLLGFGCNVPAIYATRTLEHEKQKKLTALLVPFMSCGARLPVYMLFAAAFFKGKAAIMILSIYGIGIFTALLLALVLSKTRGFRDDEILLMELPPYRLPSCAVMMHKVVQEVKGYVRKATGVVLWAMVLLWSLTYFPNGTVQDSYLARFAKVMTVIYEPLGFGNRWECVAALPGGIIAKETVVGFMDQVLLQKEAEPLADIDPLEDAKTIAYAFGTACRDFSVSLIPHQPAEKPHDSLVSAIGNLWSDDKAQVRAYSYMVYILLSIPCIMTLQALRKEYGWKLMCLSIGCMLVVPYVCSWFIFHIFSLF